jgi:hypothetical protein
MDHKDPVDKLTATTELRIDKPLARRLLVVMLLRVQFKIDAVELLTKTEVELDAKKLPDDNVSVVVMFATRKLFVVILVVVALFTNRVPVETKVELIDVESKLLAMIFPEVKVTQFALLEKSDPVVIKVEMILGEVMTFVLIF